MDINAKDKDGNTPLHRAILARSDAIIPFILAMDPDIDAQNNSKNTPLHSAVVSYMSGDSTRTVRSILIKGADSDVKNESD